MENRDHHGHHGHYESSPANNTVMLAHGGDLRIWGLRNQSQFKVYISFVYRGYEEKKASASAVYSDWHVIVLYVFSSGVCGVYCVTYVVCRRLLLYRFHYYPYLVLSFLLTIHSTVKHWNLAGTSHRIRFQNTIDLLWWSSLSACLMVQMSFICLPAVRTS